jgi:hypothetical protein
LLWLVFCSSGTRPLPQNNYAGLSHFACSINLKAMQIDKQDEIIQLLRQIERNTAKPAPWLRGLYFFFTHALTLLGLGVTAYLAWQIFGLLGSVSTNVASIQDFILSLPKLLPASLNFWN